MGLMKESHFDFAVGGQAVLEGVMMRSPHYSIVSVRDPQGGIQMKQSPFVSLISRHPRLNVPLVRGIVHLIESMKLGYSALDYSNAIFMGEDPEAKPNRHPLLSLLFGFLGALYVLGMLAFTLFLLKFLPLWVAKQAAELWPFVQNHYVVFNAIDGLTKITLFLSYISLISILKDIRRVFEYHGAEHKSIWAYEQGLPLTVENARAQTRFHPRCGTSFIFLVVLMSVLIYTIIPPAEQFHLMLLERIAVIPVIAGLSYELLKWSAKHQESFAVWLLTQPGLWIQRLTTKEPDDAQLEIALHSLKAALAAEQAL